MALRYWKHLAIPPLTSSSQRRTISSPLKRFVLPPWTTNKTNRCRGPREFPAAFPNSKSQNILKQQLDILLQQYQKPDALPEKISFATQQAVHFVKPENIIYCESDGNYTTLFFTDATRLIVSKTLREVEELLVPYQFLRIHNSFAVNLRHISRYIKTDGGSIEMINGALLPVSRQRKDEVMQILDL